MTVDLGLLLTAREFVICYLRGISAARGVRITYVSLRGEPMIALEALTEAQATEIARAIGRIETHAAAGTRLLGTLA